MKLYMSRMSPACRRVLATMYEAGRTDIEIREVDLARGEHKTPDFLRMNPNGKVPVLVDGDMNLWESTAIMQYLASDSPMWPTSRARYDITRWQCWTVAHWAPAISKVVYERVFKPAMKSGTPDEATIRTGMEEFARFAPVLEGQLQGRRFLLGDQLTLADYSVAAELTYAQPAGIDLTPYPNIRAWYGRIEERDAWKRSAPPKMA